MARENIEDIIALTPLQEGMLFHYLNDSIGACNRDMYFEQLSIDITGRIDIENFEKAWNRVVETNEVLRTVFRWEKMKTPIQLVLKEHKIKPLYYGFPGGEDVKKAGIIEKIKTKDKEKIFNLQEVPFRITLGKIEKDRFVMLVSHHHILYDGWSTGIIFKEFFLAYNDLCGGKRLLKPPVKTKFKEFVKWIQKQDKQKAGRYWQESLEGFDTQTEIPIKIKRRRNAKGNKNKPSQDCAIQFKTGLREEIEGFVETHKITLASLFYTCWGILLQKYNNCEDVVFGTTVSGRSAKVKGIEDVVGLFINTLPLRVTFHSDEKIVNALRKMDDILQKREEYESTSLVSIKEYSEIDNREELFDTVIVIENYPLDTKLIDENGGLSVNSYSMFEKTNYDLSVAVIISEDIEVHLIYRKETFNEENISALFHRWILILKHMIDNPGEKLSAVEIISGEEKNKILYEFNGRASDFPVDKTLSRLFEEQAARIPHHTAEFFEANHLTFRQLDERANQLARYLWEKDIRENMLVGLMVERSLEMIIGMLGILKAGCGYVPLNPKAPASRINYIVDECRLKWVLSPACLMGESTRTNYICVDRYENYSKISKEKPERAVCPNDIAYVIFTSGSTGKPKGVPIRHANLSPLMYWGYKCLNLSTRDRSLQNLSYYFDWSVWEIFITLTSGAGLYITPDEVLLDPAVCIDFIREKDITVLHITPTHYQSLANAALDSGQRLDTLTHLCIGAEKLNHDLVTRSYALVGDDCRIYNMYGPTETTIMAAVLEIDRSKDEVYEKLSSVPIGIPIANSDLLVLDRNLNLTPVNLGGDLYIAGDGLAPGYLNDPEKSCESFIKNIFQHNGITGEYLYVTGDTVRWLPDGSIEFFGRIDHQVKIRGYRIEPGEIENQLLTHQHIKDTAVVPWEGRDGEKHLCAYITITGEFESVYIGKVLREFLSHTMPDYMIPSYFIKMDKMPLNPNGKIDQKALPDPGVLEPAGEYAAPRNPVEKKLAVIWQQLLGVNKIGIHDDFFASGGHSLKVLNLVNGIQKEFKVKIDFQDIFVSPTIAELQQRIAEADETQHSAIRVQPKREYYELSYSQKRLWLLYEFEPNSPAFNLSGRITLCGKADECIHIVEKVLEKLINRHESFRTYFKRVGGIPVQMIQPYIPVNLEIIDLSHLNSNDLEKVRKIHFEVESAYPFELEVAPLFRTRLVKCSEEEFDLVLTMHHIISDGWSIEILEHEFFLLYESYKENREYYLKPLRIQYKDYVSWHNELLSDKEKMQTAKGFWENQLNGGLPVLNLPWDYPKKKKNLGSKGSAGYRTVIPAELAQRLRTVARENKASLFVVLLAGFNMLLSRISGQDDILLGVPGAARQHEDLKNIVGLFVNTLILRNKIDFEKSFIQFLGDVQNNMLQVLEHQSYPLELICREYKIKYPEISVFFNMITFGDTHQEYLQDHEPYHLGQVLDAKFDMVCYLTEYKNGVEISTHYFRELFRPATIEKTMGKYLKMLNDISTDPGIAVGSSYSTPKKLRIYQN